MIQTADRMSQLGTESAFTVLARAAALQADGRDIINLGIGQPDFRTPNHICDAAIASIRNGDHGYTPANGLPSLREAVAADLERRHGTAVDPARVVIVPGGKVTIFFAALMFGQTGREIIYPDPGFPIYRSAIEFSGATPMPLPLLEENGFAFSAADVLDRITPQTRLIILNSPANPTGGATPAAEMDALAEGLKAHPHVAVMSDEIYSCMLYDGVRHKSILDYPHLADRAILLDGWSKTYAMTGWRLGYGVWPEALVEPVTRLCINSHSCVNAPAQAAAQAALTGPQDAVEEMMQAFAERRRVIVEALNSLPGFRCGTPGGAFYAFPNITGTGMGAMEAQTRFLEEAGVATIAGTSFGDQGEGYLRFSYANSIDAIEHAVERIAGLL